MTQPDKQTIETATPGEGAPVQTTKPVIETPSAPPPGPAINVPIHR